MRKDTADTLFMDDVPKYRKKSKKNGERKADHKHVYTWCVFTFYGTHIERNRGFVPDDYLSFDIGTYCPICGKIGTTSTSDPRWDRRLNYTPSKQRERERWTDEALKEFNAETRTLPIFHLTDRWWQKYVSL